MRRAQPIQSSDELKEETFRIIGQKRPAEGNSKPPRDVYDHFNDPDEEWSTLPSRKAKKTKSFKLIWLLFVLIIMHHKLLGLIRLIPLVLL